MTTSLLLEKPVLLNPTDNCPEEKSTQLDCTCSEKHMASHNAMCKACSEKATHT